MDSNSKNLRIGFLFKDDVNDRRAWSGTMYYTAESLAKHCGDVHFIGPYPYKAVFTILRGLSFLLKKVSGRRFNYLQTTLVAKFYSRYFTKKIRREKYDLIFAPSGSLEIAYLETDIPIVLLSDATFAKLIDYYPDYTNLFPYIKTEGLKIQQRAFDNASMLIFSSDWAADSAKIDFNISPEKICVIPLGANIDTVPLRETVLRKKKTDTCRLLFLGVNWERKGGSIAFETLLELKRRGIKCTLTVIGCVPPADYSDPDLIVIPFLNKNNPEERKHLDDHFLNSDFLLLPTRAECYGIVFAEASAFGLPSIATATGGISGVVKEGVNGFLLPLEAKANEYADKISGVFSSDEEYYAMVESSRSLYEKSLNWDAWANGFNEAVQKSELIKKIS